MVTRGLAAAAALTWAVSATATAAALPEKLVAAELTAEQVAEKNVAARGGLEAWRKIQTMAWTGRVESPGTAAPSMPFALELKRPNKTHFEITAVDRRFVRIFDGTRGWRVRPGASGTPEAKAFSKAEVVFARDEFVIDGPLIDYQAKGVTLKLAGLAEIDGRKAYLLELALPSGASRRLWIDAQTFLDVRSDRPSTNPLIKGAPVSVYYANYRSFEGVMIPLTIESRPAVGSKGGEKLVVEKVVVNPALPEVAFAKPAIPWQRHAIVRIGGEPMAPRAPRGPGR